jgi:hypothetical protein
MFDTKISISLASFRDTYSVTVICCGKVNFGLVCATEQVENPVGLRILYFVSSYPYTPFTVKIDLNCIFVLRI